LSGSTWRRLEHALVLCVDEKSHIQALDRSQPVVAERPGQIERRSHDYTRHGGTSLFAALDIATGRIIGKCYRRHRSQEFRRFLDEIEAAVPKDLDIISSWTTTPRTRPNIRNWLAKRPRWRVHLTPTSASWINQVERFFANLTEKQIRRGVHRSTRQLEAAIKTYIENVNADPKPFKWTKVGRRHPRFHQALLPRTLKTTDKQHKIVRTSDQDTSRAGTLF